MKNLGLGTDFDGTLVDTGELQKYVANELFGKEIPATCRGKNAIFKGGLTSQEYEIVSTEALTNIKYLDKLKFQPNAKKVLISLVERKIPFEIITAREEKEFNFAQQYLKKNEVYVPLKFTGNEQDKILACRNLDIYFEDMPYQLGLLRQVVPKLILFNTYDNGESVLTEEEKEQVRNIERISDWNQFTL